MSYVIEILGDVTETSGEFEGRQWKKRVQDAVLFLPGRPYPVPFPVRLSDDQAPYAKGRYKWSDPIGYDQRRGVELQRYPRLQPLEKSTTKAA